MLTTVRQSWLLFALFVLMGLSTALNLDSLHIDGIESYLHKGNKRQASGTGNTVPSTTETPAPSATPEPSTPAEQSTPAPSPSEEQSSAPVTSAAESSAPAPSTPVSSAGAPNTTPAPAPSTSASAESSAAQSSSLRSTALPKTSYLVATSVRQITSTYLTIINGQTQVATGVTSSVATITTGQVVTTDPPETQNSSGNSGGGLSKSNQNIIGGVVGGVGGALLLGGIALVCWRIWGRKKRVSADDDDLNFNTGSALGDKPAPNAANTPFQSNLEQYHNPGGRPNAAANF
jgi:hypothetical protein